MTILSARSPILERLDEGIWKFRVKTGDAPVAIRCSSLMETRIFDEGARVQGIHYKLTTPTERRTYRGIPVIRSIEVDEECVELLGVYDHGDGWKTTTSLLVTVFVEGKA